MHLVFVAVVVVEVKVNSFSSSSLIRVEKTGQGHSFSARVGKFLKKSM